MNFSFNSHSLHPSGSTFNFFSRLTVNYISNSIKDIIDIRNLRDDLYEEITTSFPSHILRISHNVPMIWRNPSGDLTLQNYILILMIWSDPCFNFEANHLGNSTLEKILSFSNDFFTLTQKEELCKDDLLEFKLTHPQLQDWNLFGPSFLGHPFFISNLSGMEHRTQEQILSALYLARLSLLRYRRLIATVISIHKVMMYRIGSDNYRRFAVGAACDWGVCREIEILSNGIRETLPAHWWRKMEKCTHSLNYSSPLEDGYQEELKSFLEEPFPDQENHSETRPSFIDMEDIN